MQRWINLKGITCCGLLIKEAYLVKTNHWKSTQPYQWKTNKPQAFYKNWNFYLKILMFDIGKITHQLKTQYKRFDKLILVNTMQAYERVWVHAPLTFQLGTIKWWMVKFAPRPFYLPGERAHATERIRGWLGPRGDLIFFFGKGEILP